MDIAIDFKDMQKELAKALKPLHVRIEYLIDLIENANSPQMVTVKEFARLSGLNEKTVRNCLEAGKISHNQVGEGCRIMIPVTELKKIKQV